MPACRPAALFGVLALTAMTALTAQPVQAQTRSPDPEALKASVMQVLSMATFGMISVQDQQAAVTQQGTDYRMRLKLPGFAEPPDAAITALARPADNGRVDIDSMAFPSSGTIVTTLANGTPSRINYAIGKQTISAKVDPTLATESSYTADFSNLRFQTAQGDQHSDQVMDHIATEGTFSAGSDGRLTFMTDSQGTGWHIAGRAPNGFQTDMSARAIAGHVSVEGLDRAQGAHLLAAFHGLVAAGAEAKAQQGQHPAGPVAPPAETPEQRRQLGAVLEAASGLLDRIEVDETMQDLRFTFATANGGSEGTVGTLRLTMAGDAVRARLNTRLGLAVEGIDVPVLAAESGGLVPHHVALKAVLAGVPVPRLMALLRAATQQHSDPALLQAQALAMLGDPATRVAVEALSFDSGPLSVTGSAKLVPRADGQFGGEIHIAARGVDALLAQVQRQPKLQQALPIIFLAKGMARSQGDSLVWDITLGDGPPTINGTPFGQPAGRTR